MIKMSHSSELFLKKHLPGIFEHGDDIDAVLLDLDAFITREGLDANDDMTKLGHEAQAVYDDIYLNN